MSREGAAAGEEPRYRLTVAPRFACQAAWPERLARCPGARPRAGGWEPQGGFEALGDRDLADLVAESPPGVDAVLPPTRLGLVAIPERLRRLFWSEAEKDGGGMDRLFTEIDALLRFKRLPLPPTLGFEVRVSAAGARPGAASGGDSLRRTLGLVNLGDEASFVVLLPLPPSTLAARLAAQGEPSPRDLPPDALTARFFQRFPREPVLRLRLDPGEGLWLSPFGVVHDGFTRGKRDLDVMLRISGEAAPAGTALAFRPDPQQELP